MNLIHEIFVSPRLDLHINLLHTKNLLQILQHRVKPKFDFRIVCTVVNGNLMLMMKVLID